MDSQLIIECISKTNTIIKEIPDLDSEYKLAVWTVILNNLVLQKLLNHKITINDENMLDPSFNQEKITLSEFYNATKPNTHFDKILLFAYWLIGLKNDNRFEPKEIEDCYNKVILKQPKNLHDSIRKLTGGNKAYLERIETGLYKISNLGLKHLKASILNIKESAGNE